MPDPISWSFALPYLLTALAFGYLCGSIPFGLLIPKLAGLGDVREIGSGNIGATNVLRTGSKGIAAATLIADMLKGVIPAVIGLQYGPDIAVTAGFGAFIGHILPVWLKFRGGKGVATFVGVQLGLFWPIGLIFCGIWLLVAALFRMSSLSALIASALTPVWAMVFHRWQLMELFVVLAAIIFITHRGNILRLIRGEEAKISLKT